MYICSIITKGAQREEVSQLSYADDLASDLSKTDKKFSTL